MEVAEPEVGLFGEDDDSSDEEYDASAAAADEAMAECESLLHPVFARHFLGA